MGITLNSQNFHIEHSINVGSTYIERDTYRVADNTGQKHEIEVDRFICDPEKLNLVDINAMRSLRREMTGFLANPNGLTSDEILQTSGFSDTLVATGGIYFASVKKQWPNGTQTRQGDGLVWYKPDPNREGRVLSENIGHFTSGGFLLVDQEGNGSIQRIAEWNTQQNNYDGYRMIVQSNVILVHDGKEDQNGNSDRDARTALSVQENGQVSVVVVHEKNKSKNGYGLTQKEFGDLLIALGSKEAINLDGGPSAQFAVRDPNCLAVGHKCVEQWVSAPDDMPQLFTVSK